MITKLLTDSNVNIQNYGCGTANPKNYIGGLNPHHPELILAVLNGDAEKVKLIVETRENVNCTSNNGGCTGYILGDYTPIIVAVIRGNKEIVQILMDANANPLQGSYYGKNAVEWAEDLDYKEIADILNQANKNASMKESVISHIFFGCCDLLIASSFSFEVIARLNCKFYGSDYLFSCKELPRSYLSSTLVGIGAMSIVAYNCFSYAINEFKLAYQKNLDKTTVP